MKEAGAINRSLSALTNVIMSGASGELSEPVGRSRSFRSLSHGRRKVSAAGYEAQVYLNAALKKALTEP